MDISVEVAKLLSYLCAPRTGHLEAVYNIFAYLHNQIKNRHIRDKIVFDPMEIEADDSIFTKCDWKDFYAGVEDEVPPSAPTPLGNPVQMTVFIDSDHAGNVVMRQSHMGILLMLNNSPIIWYSKRQNTSESSTFGSEFIAGWTGTEMIKALRMKLRWFGIPLDGPEDIYMDNRSVVNSCIKLEA